MTQILVVDDSSVIRKVARRIFEGLRMETVEADNGHTGLQICSAEMPDAILVDWQMPVMDGLAFLSEVRRLPGGQKPKILFCTTENDPAHIARAVNAGATDHVMKPFDKDIMRAKLEDIGLI